MKYDICVIGGGIGGYSAAIKASKLGAKVCLIEKNKLGGVCLNCGCIPTKTYHHLADLYAKTKTAGKIGLNIGNVSIDFIKAKERKDKVVTKLTDGVKTLLKANKVDLLTGEAKITSNNSVRVQSNTIEYDKLIVATGSEPITLDSFNVDNENIFVPETFLDITEIPKSILIVGGGVIGVEFASIFSHLGSEITIVELLPDILMPVDSEIKDYLKRIFRRDKIKILTKTKVEEIVAKDGEVFARTSAGELTAQKAIIGIGRKPVLPDNIDNAYIIGDARGKNFLAHTAFYEGVIAAEKAMGADKSFDYNNVPSCIFTIPEIAWVGKTEDELEDYNVGRFSYAASGKASCINEVDGFAKILTDKKTNIILGCGIIGPHASDLIGEGLLMVGKKLTSHDIQDIIHPHPTLTEILFEASEDSLGQAIHKI